MAFFSPTTAIRRASVAGETAVRGLLISFMRGLPFHFALTLRSLLCPWRRGARKPIVDGFAEAFVRHWHHRNGVDAGLIEGAEVGKQIGRGFDKVASRRQIEHERG